MELPQISSIHRNLIKLFSLQTSNLPTFKATGNEQWKSIESTFRLKWAASSLGHFPLQMQKQALLSRLEQSATQAHILLAENTEKWKAATSIDSCLVQIRDIFRPPEESGLTLMNFEQIKQRRNEPIVHYYLRTADAFYPTVQGACDETFIYFKEHVIRGIYAPHIKQKVIEDNINTHEELKHSMEKHVANALRGYEMKTGAISSLDGLSITTDLSNREETIGIRSIQIKKFKGPCWTCGGKGHRAVDCDQGELCWVCKQEGHKAVECVKKISRYPQQEVWEFQENLTLSTCLSDQLWGMKGGLSPEHIGKSIRCK